jgi:tetratricopeptide (TPR) repeat protein
MYNEGIKLYEVVLAGDPDYWYANYRMGYAQYMIGHYPDAERYLARATELHGTPDEFYYLGLAQEKQDKLDGARAALEQAIKLDPGHAAAQRQLAELRQRTHGERH